MTLLMAHAGTITSLGAELRTCLDGRFAELRAQGRARMPAENLLRDPAMDLAEARQWVFDRLSELTAAGFGSAGMATRSGDAGDPAAAVVTFEMLAHGDLSTTVKSGVQFGLFGGAVTSLGTAWHQDTFLRDIADLRLLGCYAMTELGHGSDVANLETTLTYDPDGDAFVVHSPTPGSTKAYIGNAALHGSMAVVFGQLWVDGTCHGVHAALVPIRGSDGADLPGVSTADHGAKGGLPGVDNGMISFDHVRVPRRMLLDRYGGVDEGGHYSSPIGNPNRRFFTMLGTLVRGRVCIAAAGGVAARRALSIATRHALRRRQFPAPGHPDGVLLLDYLTHQRRLLPAIARAYALGYAQNELIGALLTVQGPTAHTDRDERLLQTRAAGLKAMGTRFANDTIQMCREACGGAGYLAENQLTGLRADVDVFTTFEGDNTVLLQLVAKAVLTDYQQMWGEKDRVGVVQATARVIGETVVERTAAGLLIERLVTAARWRPEELTLVDRGWHALMFAERERHALGSLARRMQQAGRAGDSFEPFNRLQDHVLFLARAHMERTTLEAFIAGIESCSDPQTRQVLERLCSLYALSSIEADRAWFLEHNRISTGRAKAISQQINALCRELRPDALALVEGLGIPEEWLGARFLEDGSVHPSAT